MPKRVGVQVCPEIRAGRYDIDTGAHDFTIFLLTVTAEISALYQIPDAIRRRMLSSSVFEAQDSECTIFVVTRSAFNEHVYDTF